MNAAALHHSPSPTSRVIVFPVRVFTKICILAFNPPAREDTQDTLVSAGAQNVSLKVPIFNKNPSKNRARAYHRSAPNGGSWEEGFPLQTRGFLHAFAGVRVAVPVPDQKYNANTIFSHFLASFFLPRIFFSANVDFLYTLMIIWMII